MLKQGHIAVLLVLLAQLQAVQAGMLRRPTLTLYTTYVKWSPRHHYNFLSQCETIVRPEQL